MLHMELDSGVPAVRQVTRAMQSQTACTQFSCWVLLLHMNAAGTA